MADHLDAASTIAAQCLCFRARRVSRLLTRLYGEALRPLGLEPTQLTLLSATALVARRDGGRASLSAVAAATALELSTVSRMTRALERDGLLRLQPAASDGRVRLASLTPAGERMLTAARAKWAEAHARVRDVLGEEGAQELHQVLDAAALAAQPLLADAVG